MDDTASSSDDESDQKMRAKDSDNESVESPEELAKNGDEDVDHPVDGNGDERGDEQVAADSAESGGDQASVDPDNARQDEEEDGGAANSSQGGEGGNSSDHDAKNDDEEDARNKEEEDEEEEDEEEEDKEDNEEVVELGNHDFELHDRVKSVLNTFFPCNRFATLYKFCIQLDRQVDKASNPDVSFFLDNLSNNYYDNPWDKCKRKEGARNAYQFVQDLRRYVTGYCHGSWSGDEEPRYSVTPDGDVKEKGELLKCRPRTHGLPRVTPKTKEKIDLKSIENESPKEAASDGKKEKTPISTKNVGEFVYSYSFQCIGPLLPFFVLQTPMELPSNKNTTPRFLPVPVNHPVRINQRTLEYDKVYSERKKNLTHLRGVMQEIQMGKKISQLGLLPVTFSPYTPMSINVGTPNPEFELKRLPGFHQDKNYVVEPHLSPPLSSAVNVYAGRSTKVESEDFYYELVVSDKKVFLDDQMGFVGSPNEIRWIHGGV